METRRRAPSPGPGARLRNQVPEHDRPRQAVGGCCPRPHIRASGVDGGRDLRWTFALGRSIRKCGFRCRNHISSFTYLPRQDTDLHRACSGRPKTQHADDHPRGVRYQIVQGSARLRDSEGPHPADPRDGTRSVSLNNGIIVFSKQSFIMFFRSTAEPNTVWVGKYSVNEVYSQIKPVFNTCLFTETTRSSGPCCGRKVKNCFPERSHHARLRAPTT